MKMSNIIHRERRNWAFPECFKLLNEEQLEINLKTNTHEQNNRNYFSILPV